MNLYFRIQDSSLEILGPDSFESVELKKDTAPEYQHHFSKAEGGPFTAYFFSKDTTVNQTTNFVPIADLAELPEGLGRKICLALGLYYPISPQYELSKKFLLPSQLPHWASKGLKSYESNRLVVYPGSFNPWHQGHGHCLDTVSTLEKLIFVVPDRNPEKEDAKISGRIFAEYKNIASQQSLAPVFPGFIGLNRPNPTAFWASQIPDKIELVLIIGDDCLFQIRNWIDSELLLNRLRGLYVIKRNFSLAEIGQQKAKLLQEFSQLFIKVIEENPYMGLASKHLRIDIDS